MKNNFKLITSTIITIVFLFTASSAFAAGHSGGSSGASQSTQSESKVSNQSGSTPSVDNGAQNELKTNTAEQNKGEDVKIQNKNQIRETIKNKYTNEEMSKLKEVEKKLKEEYNGIKVLPVENVIIPGNPVKFDTPPVIKDGRTLIPVRALSEGFGATVSWNGTEGKITIERAQIKITLQTGNNYAIVNGQEVKIDAPPEILNNRTVVPLRFIMENLGLKVNWNTDDETIEVSDNLATTASNPQK